MSRTNISPNLRRRAIHEDLLSQEISPRNQQSRDPKNEEDEDPDVSVSDDEVGDVACTRNKNATARKQGLYPTRKLDAQNFQQEHEVDRFIKISVKKSSSADHGWLGLIIGGGVLLLFLYVFFSPNKVESPPEGISAKTIVHSLKNEFTNQPRLSFKIIEKALEKVIAAQDVNQEQPSAPAILLLMNTNGAKDIAFRFAKRLANLIYATQKAGSHIIHGKHFQREDPDEAKKKIDGLIIETLKNEENKVVVITDLHVIPFKAAMILYNYCDHENAPYKNAVFIMTIDANNRTLPDDSESKQFDEAATSELSKVWSNQSEDIVAPLLSRITVGVVALH